MATVGQPTPALIGDTDVDLAAWREDGQLLGLGRPSADGTLVVSLLGTPGSSGQRLVDLPLKPNIGFAATWDVARARVLVASPAPGWRSRLLAGHARRGGAAVKRRAADLAAGHRDRRR